MPALLVRFLRKSMGSDVGDGHSAGCNTYSHHNSLVAVERIRHIPSKYDDSLHLVPVRVPKLHKSSLSAKVPWKVS